KVPAGDECLNHTPFWSVDFVFRIENLKLFKRNVLILVDSRVEVVDVPEYKENNLYLHSAYYLW
ncbi:hypothetical protein RZS08_63645, partial [Arthrospira platensis SPKY1]|nr:hypothetical protein [Arthrospira platensis SPKY1]